MGDAWLIGLDQQLAHAQEEPSTTFAFNDLNFEELITSTVPQVACDDLSPSSTGSIDPGAMILHERPLRERGPIASVWATVGSIVVAVRGALRAAEPAAVVERIGRVRSVGSSRGKRPGA